ncbi:MAG TPA: 1-acyl-sn-glycerol-3-phosphate acyltransferase [Rectinema sp.]|nr:1-acyl-sn-glycerol-3-phosphate acyltransferase [Rectinema sp.]
MRYRKGAPLVSDTPLSRLIGDILVAFIGLIGWPLCRLLYNIKIERIGWEKRRRLPSRAILVSNHCMPLDPVFHGLSILPRRTFFTLLEETCEAPVIGSLVRLLGGIPLPRNKKRLGDIERAVEHALSTRGLVHFYPEGECFLGNQNIFPFKAGAVFFAIKFGVPVIPIVTILKRANGQKSKRIQVNVHMLEPIMPKTFLSKPISNIARDPPQENHREMLSCAIECTREIHALMQAEIERSSGDKSLYKGPMPRIRGVND